MKVLLATDGSKFADDAGWLLAHLPHSKPLELVVLSVQESPHFHGSQVVKQWIEKNREAERAKAEEACKRIVDMFEGANAQVEQVVCQGHVGRQIVQEAKQREIDLVVVGGRGHSAVSRLLLGSVGDFVATHADCSVLVVRPTGLFDSTAKGLSICVAHDGSHPSNFAVTQLREFDWRRNTYVQVLSVLAFPFNTMSEPIQIDLEPIREAIQKSAEAVADSLRELSPNVSTQVIEASHVGDSIVRFAQRNACDILLLGNTGPGLLGRFLIGSVANYVVRHSGCSVWIARDRNALNPQIQAAGAGRTVAPIKELHEQRDSK